MQASGAFTSAVSTFFAETGILIHLVDIQSSGRATAHLKENLETAIYVLTGESSMWFGEKFEEHVMVKAGEFLYIPVGIPDPRDFEIQRGSADRESEQPGKLIGPSEAADGE